MCLMLGLCSNLFPYNDWISCEKSTVSIESLPRVAFIILILKQLILVLCTTKIKRKKKKTSTSPTSRQPRSIFFVFQLIYGAHLIFSWLSGFLYVQILIDFIVLVPLLYSINSLGLTNKHLKPAEQIVSYKIIVRSIHGAYTDRSVEIQDEIISEIIQTNGAQHFLLVKSNGNCFCCPSISYVHLCKFVWYVFALR